MKKDKYVMTGYPSWAQKPWWVVPDESILIEFLKVLIGIKRNIPNISSRIHEVCTIITLGYLSNLIFKDGDIIKENVNPSPRKGPDIEVEGHKANKKRWKYRAEVVTNFSFKPGAEADKLCNDVKKLVDSNANEKFLVVLFKQLEEEAELRCKSRKKNQIDLCKHGVTVLSIEKMIESIL